MVTLSIARPGATKHIADPPDLLSNLLVVAQIEQVVPITLELEPCTDPDCTDVGPKPNLWGSWHRISGKAIAVELER